MHQPPGTFTVGRAEHGEPQGRQCEQRVAHDPRPLRGEHATEPARSHQPPHRKTRQARDPPDSPLPPHAQPGQPDTDASGREGFGERPVGARHHDPTPLREGDVDEHQHDLLGTRPLSGVRDEQQRIAHGFRHGAS